MTEGNTARLREIVDEGDGTYSVAISLERHEAARIAGQFKIWAEGTRLARGWKRTYSNFLKAHECARIRNPRLAAKLQQPGSDRGAIWTFEEESDGWRVSTRIRGDILLDYAAVAKTLGEDVSALEDLIGESVPTYPEGFPFEYFWKIIDPMAKRIWR